MGQKTHPTGNRLGFIKGWDSNWYGGKSYVDKIVEDDKIRKYLRARLVKASVSRVVIERTMKLVTVTIHTARPGVIIGKGGQEVDKLREELKKLTKKIYCYWTKVKVSLKILTNLHAKSCQWLERNHSLCAYLHFAH